MTVLVVMLVFAALLALETPIAFVLAASGGLGIYLLRGPDLVSASFAMQPFSATSSYSFAAIPMFILLGMFALRGGLAERSYRLASRVFGRFRGGLGIATVAACAGFSAVCGSSVATAATMGRLSVGEMVRAGYPQRLAAGLVAGAGTLGILIPPSVMMVIYAIMAEISIGRMLLAGVVPGILTATVFAIYVGVVSQRAVVRHGALDGDLGEQLLAASGASQTDVREARQFASSQLRAAIWIVLIFCIVMTGVFTGVFTVIESGAIGALAALVMLIIETRGGPRVLLSNLAISLKETAALTAMCFAILIGAVIFTQFLVMARVPQDFASWIAGLDVPPLMIVVIILASLIPLGMALDEMAIVLITVPLLAPVVADLGYDEIWFGILFIKMMEIGLIAPPVGMNVFVVAAASGVSVVKTYRGVIPFIFLDIAVVALLIAVPDLVLWLPDLLDPATE